ncbi:hypothetical protein CH273_13095 [Rhodococcus sp. 05-339-2]|uniref:hypothetical protein n=1 Tax=Rhodococcoides fascians TaxID=1828 RepID=UPI00050C0518|nr:MULTISPECIES: hypothetical protein [Rhodococcus]OZD81607.1 hypothetical protein CH273_13095 [Rhodococcus sp. 05-339-2]
MDNDMSALLQAATYQVADLVGPVTVLEGAGQHLLSRLTETDPHRWAVTAALGSIVAARKSLEEAAEALMDTRMSDGDGEPTTSDVSTQFFDSDFERCGSEFIPDGDTYWDMPARCRLSVQHSGPHTDFTNEWAAL